MDIAELDRDVDVRRDIVSDCAQRWPNPINDRDHRSIKLAAHTHVLICKGVGLSTHGNQRPLSRQAACDDLRACSDSSACSNAPWLHITAALTSMSKSRRPIRLGYPFTTGVCSTKVPSLAREFLPLTRNLGSPCSRCSHTTQNLLGPQALRHRSTSSQEPRPMTKLTSHL
jgi:hypothetical protein